MRAKLTGLVHRVIGKSVTSDRRLPSRTSAKGEARLLQGSDAQQRGALLGDENKWDAQSGWEGATFYTSTLESFLTHARSLMAFVCTPRRWATNPMEERGIFAADYCARWQSERWPGLYEERGQINREIAHLTFARPAVGSDWRYAALRDRLNARLLEFADSADRMCPEIRERIRDALVNDARVAHRALGDDEEAPGVQAGGPGAGGPGPG